MDYRKLIELLPVEKWDAISNRLVDLILTSKNDDKLPGQLATAILHQWQNDTLKNEEGIIVLLQAAILLEPEKTTAAFNELQMTNVAEQIKQASGQ